MKPFWAALFNRKQLIYILRYGIAFILLAFLIGSIGFNALADIFITINPIKVFAVIFFLSIFLFLGILNIWLLLRCLQPIPFYSFLKLYSYSWAISLITPGQLGDASLIFFLNKYGVLIRSASIAYLTDKVISICMYLFVAWYGSNILIPELRSSWSLIFKLSISIGVLFLILIKLLPETKLTKHIYGWLHGTISELKRLRTKWYMIIINAIITAVKLLVLSICYFMAFLTFGVCADWPEVFIIPIMSTLIGYIPISIAGLGTVEFTATYLFSLVGVEMSVVLSVYLLLRSLQYIFAIFMSVCCGGIKVHSR